MLPLFIHSQGMQNHTGMLVTGVEHRAKGMMQKKNRQTPNKRHLTVYCWSEWRESNSRPLEPHSSALPNCATPGFLQR